MASRRVRFQRAWREGLPAPWDAALAGAAVAYRGGLALRAAAYAAGLRRTRRLPCHVVAVGNLTLGGTGKTPLVELLARRLAERGRRVVILSRGYGRRGTADLVVSDGARLLAGAPEGGDEPYLLARRLAGVPVLVGRDRARLGALALDRFRPDVLLLDDGFQQRRLRTDTAVVCLDARAPWGERGLFPRGTLREPPSALARADLLVVTHAAGIRDPAELEPALRRHAPAAPIAQADYEVEAVEDLATGAPVPAPDLRGRATLAFAGIAAPERFRPTLTGLDLAVRELVAFPDHHRYTTADVAALEARARAVGAETLVTTEKDAVRLPSAPRLPVWVVRVRLRLRDPAGAWWAVFDRRAGGR
jgi:tetraacyldisaccharide 4'-kinase